MLILSSSVVLAFLIHLSSTVSALSVPHPPSPAPLKDHASGAPHMAVDENGVRWSHSTLPPPGACVKKGKCKPFKPLAHLPKANFHGRAVSTTTKGYVIVVNNGVPIGYVQTTPTVFGTFTYTVDANEAQFFTRPTTISPSTKVFEIKTTTLQWGFLGADEGYPAWPPGNPDPAPVYASFAPVSESVAPATNFNNPSGQPSESNLWTMNPSTGELTARWGLHTGQYVPMQMFFDITYGDLNMARNLTAYTGYFGDVIEPIQLYFWVPPA